MFNQISYIGKYVVALRTENEYALNEMMRTCVHWKENTCLTNGCHIRKEQMLDTKTTTLECPDTMVVTLINEDTPTFVFDNTSKTAYLRV